MRTCSDINFRLLAKGWLAACVCWLLLGLSLWATLRAIGVDDLEPVRDLPLLVAAVAFAVVAGFASMLPGGLVVRDALLMQLLAPQLRRRRMRSSRPCSAARVAGVGACRVCYPVCRSKVSTVSVSGVRQNSDLPNCSNVLRLQLLTYDMLSVIIPVLDEAESLPQLVRELRSRRRRARLRAADDHRRRRLDRRHLADDLRAGGRRSANPRHPLPPQFRQGGRPQRRLSRRRRRSHRHASTATCRTIRPKSPRCWPSSTKASTSSAAGSASGTIRGTRCCRRACSTGW